ncbi:MAG: hypothetical protein RJB68_2522 [Pseudomonadota bacterium]|jgi:hypothetical protein
MALTYAKNEYAIPRGRVFFDRFDALGAKTGEIYMGNCPGVNFSVETTKAEHFSSEKGLREKDAALVVEVNRTGQLTCDNFSLDNFALFISGSRETQTQASGTVTDETIKVSLGLYYQLGVNTGAPQGVRNISAVTVTNDAGTTTYVAGTDYNIDLDLGRLQILAGGAITEGQNVKVDYTKAEKTWDRVKSGSVSELSGALRIVADNASGTNRDWYMPSVTLTPSGELPVIAEGTDFVQMQFGLEVLKPSNAEALYVDGRPAP